MIINGGGGVSSDAAYGVLTYVMATGDIDFLLNFGAEMLFETSPQIRFSLGGPLS